MEPLSTQPLPSLSTAALKQNSDIWQQSHQVQATLHLYMYVQYTTILLFNCKPIGYSGDIGCTVHSVGLFSHKILASSLTLSREQVQYYIMSKRLLRHRSGNDTGHKRTSLVDLLPHIATHQACFVSIQLLYIQNYPDLPCMPHPPE